MCNQTNFGSIIGNSYSKLINVNWPDHIDLLQLSKTPKIANFSEFLKWGSNQVCKYFNSEKNIETSRCHKIGFLLTKIGVFVVVRIIFLSRIQKCPKLDWKVWKIVHYGNLPWYTEQIQLIQCLRWYKLLLIKLGVK